MSVEDERRFDIEKDTDLSAPLLRHLGHLGYVDALEHVEPDMVEPVHVDEQWQGPRFLHAPERSDG